MHTESAHPDYSKDTDLLLTDTIMQFGSNNSNISPWHPYSKIIVWLAAITIISSIYSIHKFNTNGYNIILSPAMAPLSNTPLESTETIKHKTNETSKEFLVYNSKCFIPNLDVYNKDVKPFVHKVSYERCTKYDPLTYIEKMGNESSYLFIDHHMKKVYAPYGKLSCCYSVINRTPEKDQQNPDDSYATSLCHEFHNQTLLNSTMEFLIVKCHDFRTSKKNLVYSNSHTVVPKKEDVSKRFKTFKNETTTEPISVLMIGIDSISRLNFYRAMPITAKYLQKNNWYELKAYNKMGDNTFPNLMAIFTGLNNSQAYDICVPTRVNKLDNCSMIWYTYRNAGYATAYAEDEAEISTFNFKKKGFNKSPTDHYIRPLVLAAGRQLKTKKIRGLNYCIGSQTSEEIILNYAYQFIDTYKEDPYMGFFWMNGFSHNDLNEPSMVDYKTEQWFEMAEQTGVFNKSIVIFLSDHGIRFGKIRETHSGWLEERLPFLFIHLPQWFKDKYPTAASNLATNANRFVTPYDLHMTLQDILVKSGRITSMIPSSGCPKCDSLFNEIPYTRGCEDANIALHWCTCLGFTTVSSTSKDVEKSADIFLEGIKDILRGNHETKKLCKVPSLRRVLDSRKSLFVSGGNATHFILIIEVYPSGKFEGTVTKTLYQNGTSTFELQDGVSRIDMYASQSKCISSSYYKKYCYCKRY